MKYRDISQLSRKKRNVDPEGILLLPKRQEQYAFRSQCLTSRKRDNPEKMEFSLRNAETLVSHVQSVPSPKGEVIKFGLFRTGYEWMQKMSDSATAPAAVEPFVSSQMRLCSSDHGFPCPP